MKLGLGLYKHMLTRDNFKFAKQLGCSHLIVHLADYYSQEKGVVTATDENNNYGLSATFDPIWSLESMQSLQAMAKEEGLEIFGIENFSPADWYDVLLDGPKKQEQIEYLKQIMRNVGAAGIKSFGYNFSFAGVWGHQRRTVARGGAVSACFNAHKLAIDTPIPDGEIWNMTYAEGIPGKYIEGINSEMLWERLSWFLAEMLPVAEEAGVELALHPDDPPMPMLRKTPRLVYQPELYQKAINLYDSPSNKLDFCMGSVQEMSEGNLYDAIDAYASQGKISYAHVRNVKGKVPVYDEVFIDEGDIDMFKALRLLKKHDFQGVLIPDHTPELLCDASWHAGMAYALGYIKAILKSLETENQ
jgi:mannonate dehydratase